MAVPQAPTGRRHHRRKGEGMTPEERVIIQELVRACGAGMYWLDMASRAQLDTASLDILKMDMGVCSNSIYKARCLLDGCHNIISDGDITDERGKE